MGALEDKIDRLELMIQALEVQVTSYESRFDDLENDFADDDSGGAFGGGGTTRYANRLYVRTNDEGVRELWVEGAVLTVFGEGDTVYGDTNLGEVIDGQVWVRRTYPTVDVYGNELAGGSWAQPFPFYESRTAPTANGGVTIVIGETIVTDSGVTIIQRHLGDVKVHDVVTCNTSFE